MRARTARSTHILYAEKLKLDDARVVNLGVYHDRCVVAAVVDAIEGKRRLAAQPGTCLCKTASLEVCDGLDFDFVAHNGNARLLTEIVKDGMLRHVFCRGQAADKSCGEPVYADDCRRLIC